LLAEVSAEKRADFLAFASAEPRGGERVALFLPFEGNKEQQTAANVGTSRRSQVVEVYES